MQLKIFNVGLQDGNLEVVTYNEAGEGPSGGHDILLCKLGDLDASSDERRLGLGTTTK